ncbi:hypothetical protein STRDD11_00944 [Streptococcus sp. DD11]|nr:hypothetical protein STRDD11_00944 [Streptococcus sp. DD11]
MQLIVRQDKLSIDTEGFPNIYPLGQVSSRAVFNVHLSDDIVKFRCLGLHRMGQRRQKNTETKNDNLKPCFEFLVHTNFLS